MQRRSQTKILRRHWQREPRGGAQDAGKASDWLSKKFGSKQEEEDSTAPLTRYHGGVAGPHRHHYAIGGLPYSQAEDEYVPEDETREVRGKA